MNNYLEVLARLYFEKYECIEMAGHGLSWLCLFFWFLASIPHRKLYIHSYICPRLDNNQFLVADQSLSFLEKDFGEIYFVASRLQLNRVVFQSDKNIVYAIIKTTKHGTVSLALPDRLFWMDLAIYMDIQRNPGPVASENSIQTSFFTFCNSNIPAVIKYSRTELLGFRSNPVVTPDLLLKQEVNDIYFTGLHNAIGFHNVISLPPRSKPIPVIEATRRLRSHNICKRSKRLGEHRNHHNLVPVHCVTTKPPSKIKLGIWNAQSINKKSGIVCDIVISERLDIFAITETWISGNSHDNNTIAEILNTLKDFQFVDIPRPNRTGGGVGVFLRKGFKVQEKDRIQFSSMEYLDLEICHSSSSMRLVTIYRPTRSKKNRATPAIFREEFSTLLEMLTLAPGYLLLNGDLNFHIDVETDASANAFKDLLESAGLTQHITGPTHRSGHTLDLIIDRQEDVKLSSFSTLSDVPSDHHVVLCCVDFAKPAASKSQYKHRCLRDMDMNAFKTDIAKSPLSIDHTNCDPNELADLYNTELRKALDKHAPLKSRFITLRPHAPWFTSELRNLKREKRRCERVYRASGLEVHRQIYREQCRQYIATIDQLKSQYYKCKIETADQCQLFRLIDGMFRVKPVASLPSYTSLQDLTERFGTFFVNRIADLRQKLPMRDPPTDITPSCSSSFAEFCEVSLEVIKEVIEKSPSKSCPLDPVPTRTLKSCLNELLPALTSLVNSSLKTGVFPDSFKEGRLLPKIKKVSLDKEEFSNFRPITNLPFVSKILERIAANQTCHYLRLNNLYPKFQAAYQQFHSTETALLRVHNDVLRAIDSKKEVILIMLDLSAAFDTIDYDILIRRLHTQFGFKDIVLQWFTSYVRGRYQRVAIGDVESARQPLSTGVPQGSVLGPLLFILYLAPLEDVIKHHGLDCMMYADDSQLYITVNPDQRQLAIANLEQCIADIQSFFVSNKLCCNSSKTDIVHFHSRFSNLTSVTGITIGHHTVSTSNEARNLGVILDKHLTMSSHINNVCRSGSLALRNIGRIRKYLDSSSTERLVHAFIMSKLDYCNSLLYGLPDKDLNKLQRLQNSAARLVTRTKIRDHITPVLKSLHWLPVKHRITFKILLTVYKIVSNGAPAYLSDLLELYVPKRSLRSASQGLLTVPQSSTVTYGDRAFSVSAPKLWNCLPTAIRNAGSVISFKSQVKTYLFKEAFCC